MVENIAAKAATVETASLGNQGLAISQKDLLSKMASSKDGEKRSVTDTDSALSLLESGNDSEDRASFLSSHLSKMANKGFDFSKVTKFENKMRQFASELEDGQDSVPTQDAVQVGSKYVRQTKGQRSQLSKLAQLAESFETSPQQKAVVQRYVQSYFGYLMSDDPKTKNRMKADEQALRQSGFKEDNIFSLQKQIKTAARADISVRIKENLFIKEFSGSGLESAISDISTNVTIGSAINNQKTGGLAFKGAFGDLQSVINNAWESNKQDISEFVLQDLENQMISKMLKGTQDTSDLDTHVSILLKMGINVASWIEKDWSEKRIDLGFVTAPPLPEDSLGNLIDFNSDGQGQGREQQQQNDGELMMGQLRSLYVQRLINGGFASSISISFKIRKLKNGLLKMGLYSEEFEEKLAFEAETIAKKKIMDMLEEAMIERAGLFKLKGKAYDTHEKKVKQLLKAADRLGMKVDEQDLVRIRESVNPRMIKIVSAQLEVLELMIAKKGSTRKAQKNLDSLKALKERLTRELNVGTLADAPSGETTDEKAILPEKEPAYV